MNIYPTIKMNRRLATLMKSSKLIITILISMSLLPLTACTKEEDGQFADMGEPVFHDSVLGDQEITLKSASKAEEHEGKEPEFDLFMITKVTFKNVSDDPVLHVYQPSKIGLNSSLPVLYDDLYTGDYIDPGDSRTETFVFDVEESDEYRLHYNFGMFRRLDITWNLSKEDFE